MSESLFTPIVTEAGQAARMNAVAQGYSIKITHVAFGASGYTVAVNGDGKATATALTDEMNRVEIQDVRTVGETQKDLSFVLDTEQEYHIREIGIFLEDGTLFAVASHPTIALDWVSAATRNLFAIELVIDDSPELVVVSSGDNLNLLMTRELTELSRIDALLSLRAFRLEDGLREHSAEDDPHPVYLTPGRGDGRYEAKGARSAHERASDPHNQYLTPERGDGRYYTQEQVDQALAQAAASVRVPAGQVMQFAGAGTPPGGYLRCDGAEVSRTDYPDLFAAIGTTYGAGDGATTFAVPDTRGLFARDLDEGAGKDAGRTLGTPQEDAVQDHDHLQGGSTKGELFGASATASGRYTGADIGRTPFTSALSDQAGQVNPRFADETRPKNIAFRWFIKT